MAINNIVVNVKSDHSPQKFFFIGSSMCEAIEYLESHHSDNHIINSPMFKYLSRLKNTWMALSACQNNDH